jgi:peroxiredoxin Q/BCP
MSDGNEGEPMTELSAGDTAPDFTLPRDGGGEVSLAEFRGRKIVVFFYPRDDTSGCTKEAVAFSNRLADFEAAGIAVIGISKDSIESHDKFRAKHGLQVTLLSDENSDVCERFGVWREKSMYGRKFMGIERSTFLIGETGTVLQAWRKVKVPGHAEAVLDAAEKS